MGNIFFFSFVICIHKTYNVCLLKTNSKTKQKGKNLTYQPFPFRENEVNYFTYMCYISFQTFFICKYTQMYTLETFSSQLLNILQFVFPHKMCVCVCVVFNIWYLIA